MAKTKQYETFKEYYKEMVEGKFIKVDGTPIKCVVCGGHDLTDNIKDVTAGTICEYECVCNDCETVNGYWAYGNWDI